MNYISNLSKDAIIVVNQSNQDWLARVSQITDLNSQEIIKAKQELLNSIGIAKNDILTSVDNTLLDYVTHNQLDSVVQDIKAKTDEQITVTLWHYAKKSEIDEIIELDYLVNYYTKEDINNLFNDIQNNTNTSLSNIYTKGEVNSIISVVNNRIDDIKNDYSTLANIVSRTVESVEQTLFSDYYVKEEVDNLLDDVKADTDKIVDIENKFNNYVELSLHNQAIQNVKTYVNTQINNAVSQYVKIGTLKNQLDAIKNSLANTLNLKFSNVYTKAEIDKKFEEIGKAYVQILSPREYQTLKAYGQIKDNNLYLIQKYGRPIELYIGKLLFAKRSDDLTIGFPYTFPMVF